MWHKYETALGNRHAWKDVADWAEVVADRVVKRDAPKIVGFVMHMFLDALGDAVGLENLKVMCNSPHVRSEDPILACARRVHAGGFGRLSQTACTELHELILCILSEDDRRVSVLLTEAAFRAAVFKAVRRIATDLGRDKIKTILADREKLTETGGFSKEAHRMNKVLEYELVGHITGKPTPVIGRKCPTTPDDFIERNR